MKQSFENAGETSATQAQTTLGTIAAMKGTAIKHKRPILEAELPLDGSRFEELVSPVVRSPVSRFVPGPGEHFGAAIAEKKNILAAGYTNRLFGILAVIEFAWAGSADTLALLQAMQASNGAASVPVGNAAASVRFTFTRRSLIGHKPPGESGCPN